MEVVPLINLQKVKNLENDSGMALTNKRFF